MWAFDVTTDYKDCTLDWRWPLSYVNSVMMVFQPSFLMGGGGPSPFTLSTPSRYGYTATIHMLSYVASLPFSLDVTTPPNPTPPPTYSIRHVSSIFIGFIYDIYFFVLCKILRTSVPRRLAFRASLLLQLYSVHIILYSPETHNLACPHVL